jgi:hypothetical protein
MSSFRKSLFPYLIYSTNDRSKVSFPVVYQCHALSRIHKIIKLFWDRMTCSAVKSQLTFRRNIQPPSSDLKSKTVIIPDCFILISCLAYSSTLKVEAIYFSEESADFTGLYGIISEDRTLHSHHFENLKTNKRSTASKFTWADGGNPRNISK